jgi:hypothetical protein
MVVQNFDVWVIVEEKAIALALQNGRSVIKEGERLFVLTGNDDIHGDVIALNQTSISGISNSSVDILISLRGIDLRTLDSLLISLNFLTFPSPCGKLI